MSAEKQVRDAYALLKGLRGSLPDCMQVQVDEWMEGLREDVKLDKASVDWEAYGTWINEICDDEGMPRLYE